MVPGRIICYVTERYGGQYTGWSFSDKKRAERYFLARLNLGSFHDGVEQTTHIEALAEMVMRDSELVNGTFNREIFDMSAKPCKPECSVSDDIHALIAAFCGMSLILKKEDSRLYSFVRAYAANLTEGLKN